MDKEFAARMLVSVKKRMIFKHFLKKNNKRCVFNKNRICSKRCSSWEVFCEFRCMTGQELVELRSAYEIAVRGGAEQWKKDSPGPVRIRQIKKCWLTEHIRRSKICLDCPVGEDEYCSINGIPNQNCKQVLEE